MTDLELASTSRASPGLDPSKVQTIKFVFDRKQAGAVVIDDIGFVGSS
jgi:hypothetical protein